MYSAARYAVLFRASGTRFPPSLFLGRTTVTRGTVARHTSPQNYSTYHVSHFTSVTPLELSNPVGHFCTNSLRARSHLARQLRGSPEGKPRPLRFFREILISRQSMTIPNGELLNARAFTDQQDMKVCATLAYNRCATSSPTQDTVGIACAYKQ